ncbi:GAF domain-containing protein [Desulfopila sp. IMCC35008]|uniref:GAF domain-containing protein n=1 Tax=Desulfopila sp. IMCC35008 TaxID=2653858 RepID=UPI0013D4223D|nr:GAF domain-containing protein [Desulfopila sp. IMCC35008]
MTNPAYDREHDYLEVYQEVTRHISMLHDPQQVMELVVSRLPDLLEVDAATIRLLDDSTNSFVIGAAHGLSEEYLARQTIDTQKVMAELRSGQPIASSTLVFPCDMDSSISVKREGIKSALSLPILYREKVIGLLRLLTRVERDYTRSEISFAMSLAEQVGIALSNSRLFQEQQNQLTFFKELRTISRLVNSTLDLDQILKSIVDKMPRIMKVKGCTIRLVDPATNRLELAAASGLSRNYLSRGSIRKEDSIFTALKGEPVAIYDATSDPRVKYHAEITEEGIKSILAIPIKNELEVIGVLRLLCDTHRTFTPGEINFAVTAAEEGGNAIQKARTYRKITLLFNQIEEHERFLQTIMDSLWLNVLVLDPNKHVVMANRMFLDNQDLSETDLLGKSYDAISPWPESTRNNEPVDQVLNTAAPVAILEKIETEEGTSWFERHLTPIVSDEGNIEFIIEAVRDITDQRLLEMEKMEKMKLQGVIEMAGTAAHQLNSPLFAALGTAQLLADDLTDQQSRDDLDLIIRNLKQIAELTREMTIVTGFESSEYVGETRLVKIKTANQED